jgi:hypothetical protein
MRIARRQKSHRKCYQSRMAFRLLRCLVNALIAFIWAREPWRFPDILGVPLTRSDSPRFNPDRG